ncbi:hypothetical protein SprV_0200653900 [Sparganum proliferum]
MFGSVTREPRNAQYIAILVIVEIALCAATLAKKTELGSAVESMVKTSFSKQFNDPTIRSAFGLMEEELDCCGIKGASDYKNANQDIPRTCEWEHYRNSTLDFCVDRVSAAPPIRIAFTATVNS